MAPSCSEFVESLIRSGLMTKPELRVFEESLPPDRQSQDAEGLAKILVAEGKLTRYQARMLWEGKTKGLVLGNYALLEKLGEGGMAKVFKAKHRLMDRIVALKLLPPSATQTKSLVDRFHREMQAAAKLRHPNIITAHDADEAKGIHFLVTEFVEGPNLEQVVEKNGPLPLPRALDYILQVAKGLACAHGAGIIHRDVKPANMLLDAEGTVKILDMGTARIYLEVPLGESLADFDVDRNSPRALTGTNQILGTADFMAPEQAEDSRSADHRSDIYSLGCTLYFLLTGKHVYEVTGILEKFLAHLEAPIPSLGEARDDIPDALDQLFQKMLAKKPEDRFGSMDEIIDQLEAVLDS